MRTVAYVATSLDGYIADSGGGVDRLNEIPNPERSDYGFSAFIQTIDAILMGAKTFKFVQSCGQWPYEKDVYVLSKSIREVPAGFEKRIKLVSGRIEDVLAKTQSEAGPNIYVDGGKVIQSCLDAKCLSQLVITTIPILLGRGLPLFVPRRAHPGEAREHRGPWRWPGEVDLQHPAMSQGG